MLFPEGTRNSAGGGSLLPFKKGAFHVALDIGVPILPIVISEFDFLGPDGERNKKFSGGSVTIKILPPIQTEGIPNRAAQCNMKASAMASEVGLTNGIPCRKRVHRSLIVSM